MRLDREDAESLRDELSRLRKNEGFVKRRLASTPIVDEVLRYSCDDTYERLKSRFISAIHSLTDPDEASLLFDVFALSPETESVPRLQQRRVAHGKKIGRGIDTVAHREAAALDHLHSRLLTGTYAQSPLVLHVPEMHGGIVYEHTSTLIVVDNRRWRETHEYYRFANMCDELDYVTVTRSYDGLITPSSGGAFKVNTRRVAGAGYNDHFWHLNESRTSTAPMVNGNVYDLRFAVTPEPGSDAATDSMKLGSRAFHHRSLLASIEVMFIGEKPTSIWKFENVSPYARPAEEDDQNRVSLSLRGIATLRVRDVHGGLFCGINWRW